MWQLKAEYDKAIADYDKAIEIDPKYVEAYNDRGWVWHLKTEYDKAIADYDRAIEIDPENVDAYSDRGWVWQLKAEYDKAIADYDRAIEIDPTSTDAYSDRGLVWQLKAEYGRAIADYNRATEIDTENVDAYGNRGWVWHLMGESDKAIADLDEAIRLDPEDCHLYHCRGIAWVAERQYKKAVADFNEAIRLDPKDCRSYASRAWLRATCPKRKFRDGQAAIADATRACELTEWNSYEHLDTLAAAYAEAGDFDKAVQWQIKAIKEAPREEKPNLRDRLAQYQQGQPYRDTRKDSVRPEKRRPGKADADNTASTLQRDGAPKQVKLPSEVLRTFLMSANAGDYKKAKSLALPGALLNMQDEKDIDFITGTRTITGIQILKENEVEFSSFGDVGEGLVHVALEVTYSSGKKSKLVAHVHKKDGAWKVYSIQPEMVLQLQ